MKGFKRLWCRWMASTGSMMPVSRNFVSEEALKADMYYPGGKKQFFLAFPDLIVLI